MPLETPSDLLLFDLSTTYGAEQTFMQELSDVQQMARDPLLMETLQRHVDQMPLQMRTLEECFDEVGERARTAQCDAASGLVKDFQRITNQAQDAVVLDLAITDLCSKMRHFQIGAYRSLANRANINVNDRLADLLGRILADHEKAAREIDNVEADIARRARKELPPEQPQEYVK